MRSSWAATWVAVALAWPGYGLAQDLGPQAVTVSAKQSFVAAVVYKAGAASAVSHDHAIQAKNLSGTGVWHPTDAAQCAIEVTTRVSELLPDPPEVRVKVGLLAAGPSESQREEVLSHIKADYQLDSARHDTIRFVSTRISGTSGDVLVSGEMTIRGVTRTVEVPMRLTRLEDGLRARGKLRIKQTDFGYKPFSALFGALAVKDEVDIVMDIVLVDVE